VQKILVLVAADSLGKGKDELGRKIVINFIRTMKEMGDDLWRLVLLNSGVKLAVRVRKFCRSFKPWPAPGSASWSAAPARRPSISWKNSRWGNLPAWWIL
jgi:hypothetical protein